MSLQISKLKPCREGGTLNVVIETPKGSRIKFAYEEKAEIFELSKIMPAGMEFPYNFGFLPGTRCGDGDALDVLVLLDAPATVGCLIPSRGIGVIGAEQTEDDGRIVQNDRIIAVPVEIPGNTFSDVTSLKELNPQLLRELRQFFVNYNALRGVKFKLLDCHGPERVKDLIQEAVTRFQHPVRASENHV